MFIDDYVISESLYFLWDINLKVNSTIIRNFLNSSWKLMIWLTFLEYYRSYKWLQMLKLTKIFMKHLFLVSTMKLLYISWYIQQQEIRTSRKHYTKPHLSHSLSTMSIKLDLYLVLELLLTSLWCLITVLNSSLLVILTVEILLWTWYK